MWAAGLRGDGHRRARGNARAKAQPAPRRTLPAPHQHGHHHPRPPGAAPPPAPPQILKEDDANWPLPDRVGKQELEVKLGGEHICFNTTKLGSVLQVQQSKDPDGLRIFYYLVQDLKVRAPRVWSA